MEGLIKIGNQKCQAKEKLEKEEKPLVLTRPFQDHLRPDCNSPSEESQDI